MAKHSVWRPQVIKEKARKGCARKFEILFGSSPRPAPPTAKIKTPPSTKAKARLPGGRAELRVGRSMEAADGWAAQRLAPLSVDV